MDDSLSSMLIGTIAVWVLAAAAVWLTSSRPIRALPLPERDRLLRLFLLAISLQCLHFLEEFLTGFHVRFPPLWGLQPWTAEFFVAFNVCWIAVWSLCAAGVLKGVRAAYFSLWLLALALLVNGIAHPGLSLRVGGYFPGLLTSPLEGWLGIVLWGRLWRLSDPLKQRPTGEAGG